MKCDLSADAVVRRKAELRQEARRRLRAFSADELAARSAALVELAANLPELRAAACCAFFVPLRFEPTIRPLIELAWSRSQRVALPRRVEGGVPNLDWREVSGWSQLSSGGLGMLLEPDPQRCPVIHPTDLNCVLVPGLAFDARGNRLGRGGGFYDAALAKLSGATDTIGVMFAAQEQDRLPCSTHDRPLHAIVTEAGFTRFGLRSDSIT